MLVAATRLVALDCACKAPVLASVALELASFAAAATSSSAAAETAIRSAAAITPSACATIASIAAKTSLAADCCALHVVALLAALAETNAAATVSLRPSASDVITLLMSSDTMEGIESE